MVEPITLEYADNYEFVDIKLCSADTTITASTDGRTHLYYEGNEHINFKSNVTNNCLFIKEEVKISSLFKFDSSKARLNLLIPQKEYKLFELSSVSGSLDADNLISKQMKIYTNSGSKNIRGYAEDIELKMTSGDIQFTNITDRKSNNLEINSTSGNCRINGVMPNYSMIKSTSGSCTLDGFTGRLDANSTSTNFKINCKEWNSDWKLKSISANYDITLPQNSAVDLKAHCISGKISALLGGTKNVFRGNSIECTIGSGNKHQIEINSTSGNCNLSNNNY